MTDIEWLLGKLQNVEDLVEVDEDKLNIIFNVTGYFRRDITRENTSCV